MSSARTTTDGDGVILFGGSGFLGPYILERAPKMISVGRSKPPVANRHIPVDTLENLDALEGVYFDRVIYIIGNTDHYNMEKEAIPRGEPTAFDYHVIPFVRVMEQLKRYPIRKFIHFSTTLLYDENKVTYSGRFYRYLRRNDQVIFRQSLKSVPHFPQEQSA